MILYLGCSCIAFHFTTQMTLSHLLPMPLNKKLDIFQNFEKDLCKGSLMSISSESWKINLLYQYSMVQILKIILFRTQNVSSLTVELYTLRQKIFQLGQCKYTVIQIAFFWDISHLSAGLFCSVIKVLSFLGITSLFWSFIVSCCSLILLLPNIACFEGLFRYGTKISRYP